MEAKPWSRDIYLLERTKLSNPIEHQDNGVNRCGNEDENLKGARGSQWRGLAGSIQSALDDPQPSVCHREVMARMKKRIAASLRLREIT